MKTKKILLSLTAFMISGSVAFTSCKKKELEQDEEEQTAVDNNIAENITDDILNIGGQASENNELITYRSSGPSESLDIAACATLKRDSVARTITIDFGTGCQGRDGRTRSGSLVFDYSACNPSTAIRYRNPGFNLKITSNNYMVDGYKIQINSKSIVNTTPQNIPAGTKLSWAIKADISIIKPNNEGTITWACNRVKELVNSADTTCYRDQTRPIRWQRAIVRLNGKAEGVNAKGENFTAIATDLIRNFSCSPEPVLRPHRHPFISGTIAYSPGKRPTRLVDFGNGACDLSATVTVNNRTKTITLR